jgi:hypothetical protein
MPLYAVQFRSVFLGAPLSGDWVHSIKWWYEGEGSRAAVPLSTSASISTSLPLLPLTAFLRERKEPSRVLIETSAKE